MRSCKQLRNINLVSGKLGEAHYVQAAPEGEARAVRLLPARDWRGAIRPSKQVGRKKKYEDN